MAHTWTCKFTQQLTHERKFSLSPPLPLCGSIVHTRQFIHILCTTRVYEALQTSRRLAHANRNSLPPPPPCLPRPPCSLARSACSDITDVDTDLLVDSFEKYFMSFQKLADDVCWRHTPMCHGPIEHKDEIIMAHVSGETWGDNFVWESFENQEGGITDGSHLDL